jgi:transposase InsO family protein
MVYVAFVVDAFAQRIVGWHAMVTRPAELVLVPLRLAAWARGQDGHPVVRGELVHHSDAGSPSTPRSGSPSTSNSKASPPRSGASVTPTTTP